LSQIFKTLTSGGPFPPNIPTQFTTDAGVAIPSANNVNVFGGTGTTTSAAGSTITITVQNDGFTWSEKNGDFNAAIQNGYFCNALLTATLPASGGLTIGNSIIFFVDTASVVTIQAGAGERIQVGSVISAAGGMTTSNARGATLELVFKPTDLTWHTISSLGVWSTT
jgi:hypothetical protein